MVACPLCNTQIHSGKIEKNTTENFNWKVEEEDHDAVVNGGFGSTILMRRQEAVFVWWGGERRAETVPKPSTHRIACTELWTQTWDSSLVRPLQQAKTPYHMGQFLFQLTRQSSPMSTKKFSSSTLVWPHSSPPIAATRALSRSWV